MRKLLFIFLFLTSVGMLAVKAQTDQPIQVEEKAKDRKWFIEGGLSFYLQGSDQDYYGGIISVGLRVAPHNFLSLDIGGYFRDEKIGEFSYIVKYNNGTSKTYYDGVITRDYSVVPVLITWAYEFDLSPKFHLRVGPSLGMTMLSASDTYDPDDVEGKPGPNTDSKEIFSYGIGVGIARDVFKRSSINLGYRLLGNSKTTFEEVELKPVSHQINLTYRWRF